MGIPQESANWGRGRLNPYESIVGFSAKFCVLNGISPFRFRRFLGDLLEHRDWIEEGLTVKDLNAMARFLDEPVAVVRTLEPIDIDLARRGILSHQGMSPQYAANIYGCRKCVEYGYHASFHEFRWLNKCPIHETELTVLAVSDRVGTPFDRRVQALIRHFNKACPKWPLPPRKPKSSWWSMVPLETLKKLRRWSAVVNSVATRMMAQQVWSSTNVGPPVADLGVLFGRVKALCPIPQEISELFCATPYEQSLQLTVFDPETTQQWKRSNLSINLEDLLWFYQRHCGFVEEEKPYCIALREAVREIQGTQATCRCRWGWSRYSGWCPADPDGWPHWGYICAHRFAIDDLKRTWGDFRSVMSSGEIAAEWRRYYTLTEKFQRLGFIDVQQPAYSSESKVQLATDNTVIHFRLDQKLLELANVLLTEEVNARANYLKQWLRGIEIGGSPWVQPVYCPTLGVLESNDELTLLKWLPPRKTAYE